MTRQRMDLQKVAKAGERRRRALQRAEAEVDLIADELLAVERPNVSLAAELTGVARTTLYRRMQTRRPRTPA